MSAEQTLIPYPYDEENVIERKKKPCGCIYVVIATDDDDDESSCYKIVDHLCVHHVEEVRQIDIQLQKKREEMNALCHQLDKMKEEIATLRTSRKLLKKGNS